MYTLNVRTHDEATVWGSTSNGNHDSGTSGPNTLTGSWGGRFSHSTVNWSGDRDGSVTAIPDDSPRSPDSPGVA